MDGCTPGFSDQIPSVLSTTQIHGWMYSKGFQTRYHQFSQLPRYMDGFTPGFSDQIPSVLSTT